MTKLLIPKDVTQVRLCNTLSWMRLRLDEESVTGMIVGPKSNEFLLYVTKDGEVRHQAFNLIRNIAFIDYLTEDESVTIFGEAGERTEDDLAPMITPVAGRPELQIGCDAYLVPDFIPFRQRVGRSTLESVTFPGAGDRAGLRTSLSFDLKNDWRLWGKMKKNDGREFLGYLDNPSLERWRKHPLLREGRTVGVDQWPST